MQLILVLADMFNSMAYIKIADSFKRESFLLNDHSSIYAILAMSVDILRGL